MIDRAQAQRLLWDQARPLGSELTDLRQAYGRVLSAEVLGDRDFPPTDRSAMDGYAVRSADLGEGACLLEVIGESRAGRPADGLTLARGQAVRIMTGGVLPAGADAVVMVEKTRRQASPDRVRVEDEPAPGQHIRRRGQDLRAGESVLAPGVPIHAPEVSALASVGATRVEVFRRPVVSVLATGDEVVDPGERPLPHQLRNSNSETLLAQLRELEIRGEFLGIAGDDREDLDRRLRRGIGGDCLLVTGGVSVGKYDLVGDALEALGIELLFHRVAMKPGKPLLAGRCGDCLVVGLPGNPVSTYVGFAAFVAPALRKMLGYRRWANLEITAILEEPLRAKPGRETFHLARATATTDGITARRISSTGSGDALALARANALVVTAADVGDLPAGAPVPTLLWRDFHLR